MALFDGYGLSRERPVKRIPRVRPVKKPKPMRPPRMAKPMREPRVEGLGHLARPVMQPKEEVFRPKEPGISQSIEERLRRNRGIGRY